MSGAFLLRNALQRGVRLGLPAVAERDRVAVLEAAGRGSFQLFYDAAIEAQLESRATRVRRAGTGAASGSRPGPSRSAPG